MPFVNAFGNGRQRQCRHIRSQPVVMGLLDRFNRQTARDGRSALRAFVPVDDEAATLDLQRVAIPAIRVLSVLAQAKPRSKLFLFHGFRAFSRLSRWALDIQVGMHGRLRTQDLKGVQLHVDGNARAPYRKTEVGLAESYRDGVELLLLVEEPVLDAGIFNARRWWRVRFRS